MAAIPLVASASVKARRHHFPFVSGLQRQLQIHLVLKLAIYSLVFDSGMLRGESRKHSEVDVPRWSRLHSHSVIQTRHRTRL